jgi:hypothetical protein
MSRAFAIFFDFFSTKPPDPGKCGISSSKTIENVKFYPQKPIKNVKFSR